LASGDPFLITQEAGNGSTWSYTATANLVITCYGNQSAGTVRIGTWVTSTSGVLNYINSADSASQNQTQLNKMVVTSGTTLTMNNVDVDLYGIYIGGFEL
jgi:hypothetical protein